MASSANSAVSPQSTTAVGLTFRPLQKYLGGPLGRQKLDVAAEVTVRHERHDETIRNGELSLLVNRHVHPDTQLPSGVFVNRETPGEEIRREGPYLSLAVRPPEEGGDPVGGELDQAGASNPPHAREWDFLKEKAEEALREAGVSAEAPDRDKIDAFSNYVMRYKKSPVYGSFHPVDVLFHGTYCTGAANLLFALANVEGVPARSISIWNHSMVELWIDGRWHFADNHADGPRFVPGSDYVDVTLEAGEFESFTARQKEYLSQRLAWARSPWHYSGTLAWHWAWGDGKGRGIRTDVIDGYGVSVPFDPHHARALYPERSRFPFPLWNGKPELTLTEKASWLRADLPLPPGEALLKSVYIGACEDNPITAAWVDWWVRGEIEPGDAALHCGPDGEPLRAEAVISHSEGVKKLRFALPVDRFAEPGQHALALVNQSAKPILAIVYPTPLETSPPIYSREAIHIRAQSLRSEPK